MSINPDRALARVKASEEKLKATQKVADETTASLKAAQDKQAELIVQVPLFPEQIEAARNEFDKLIAEAAEEIRPSLLIAKNDRLATLNTDYEFAADALKHLPKKIMNLTADKIETDTILSWAQSEYESRKKAWLRKVTEYPRELARHLNKCSSHGFKDIKERTYGSVLAAEENRTKILAEA